MNPWKIAVLFVLGITSVLPTLWGTFIFDDGEAILKNEDVTNPSDEFLYRVFHDDFWGVRLTHPLSHKSFRPLTTLTFRWNYLSWGKDAFRFHLVNLGVHGVNCVLVYFFLLKCLGHVKKYETIAYAASIVFAVHPVHVEPLGGLVGRADLMAATVFMSAFILMPKEIGILSGVAMAIFSILGSLFKETGIMAVVLFILLHMSSKKCLPSGREVRHYLASLVIVVSFMLWRLWYQGGPPVFQPYDNPPAFASTRFSKFFSIIYVWMLNIKLLVFPNWLCYDWSMGCITLITSPFDIRVYLVLAFIAVTLRLSFAALKERVVRVALLIGAATFFPASNVLVTVGFVLAERNLYLPCAGYSLLASYAFLRKGNWKVFAFIVTMFYLRSVQRSIQWTNDGLLFQSGLQVCPGNAKVHYNLGTYYGEVGDREKAVAAYKTAIALKPDYYQSMNNLGNLLRSSDRFEEAESLLRKAVEIKSDFAAAWMNLGIVISKKNATEALICYYKALEFRKRYPDCEYNLGNLYLDLGDKLSALKSWKKAVSLKPTHAQSWINIIILLDQEGRVEDARDWALEAARILPTDDTVHFLLGNVLGKLSKFQEAENHFKEAIRLRLSSGRAVPAKYHANLGVLYHRWNRKSAAKSAYETALEIDPNMGSVYKNLESLKNLKESQD